MMNVQQLNPEVASAKLVVHIDETLGMESRRDVEQAVEQEYGVSQARFNSERPHLMIVGYDPRTINSMRILGRIRQQKLSAQLIG